MGGAKKEAMSAAGTWVRVGAGAASAPACSGDGGGGVLLVAQRPAQ